MIAQPRPALSTPGPQGRDAHLGVKTGRRCPGLRATRPSRAGHPSRFRAVCRLCAALRPRDGPELPRYAALWPGQRAGEALGEALKALGKASGKASGQRAKPRLTRT